MSTLTHVEANPALTEWTDEVSNWRREQAAAEAELTAALDRLHRHDADLTNHVRFVRDLDLFAPPAAAVVKGKPAAAPVPEGNAQRQQWLKAAHANLREHHHVLMQRITLALKTLGI